VTEPTIIAEHEGYTLSTFERPPGGPQGLTVRVEGPLGHLDDHSILVFHRTFKGDEELAETQVERNALKAALVEAENEKKGLRKEMGEQRRKMEALEAELAKGHAEVRAELAQAQIKALQRAAAGVGTPDARHAHAVSVIDALVTEMQENCVSNTITLDHDWGYRMGTLLKELGG